MKRIRPSQSPTDYSDAKIVIALSPDWYAMMQGLMQAIENRVSFEDMSNSDWIELVDWFDEFYLLDNMESELVAIGTILDFAGSTVPDGYLICDGAAVSRTTYADLFALIGEQYGIGDGLTTFNVPDLRGRFALGKDNMGGNSANRVTASQADTLGAGSGVEEHTLSIAEMPAHTHSMNNPNNPTPQGLFLLETPASTRPRMDVISDSSSTATQYTTNIRGGSLPHENMPPYVTLNKIIKY